MNVMVETSARHIHVSKEDLEALFGAGYELNNKKELSQPGQYVCHERLTVVGPKREIPGVSILGPVRPATQVEISLTDARSIGVAAPIRESGNVAGSPGCVLKGPAGEITLSEGVIVAKRHLHCTPETAEKFGITDKQIIGIECGENERKVVFGDVVVRVAASFADAVHIDTDESNAAGGPLTGKVVK